VFAKEFGRKWINPPISVDKYGYSFTPNPEKSKKTDSSTPLKV
jgi:hypothetical protein